MLPSSLLQASTGQLDKVKLEWNDQAAVTVVMAAKGYPGDYKKGTVIRGLDLVTGAKVGSERGRCSTTSSIHVVCISVWQFGVHIW